MGRSSQGNSDCQRSAYALGLVTFGSAFGLLGSFAILFSYPASCFTTGNDTHPCTVTQVLILVAIITLLTSGSLMMICGLLILCCSSNTSSKKATKKEPVKTSQKISAKLKAKSRMTPTYVIMEEEPNIIYERPASKIIYYNPSPMYLDQNLVLGSQNITNERQLDEAHISTC